MYRIETGTGCPQTVTKIDVPQETVSRRSVLLLDRGQTPSKETGVDSAQIDAAKYAKRAVTIWIKLAQAGSSLGDRVPSLDAGVQPWHGACQAWVIVTRLRRRHPDGTSRYRCEMRGLCRDFQPKPRSAAANSQHCCVSSQRPRLCLPQNRWKRTSSRDSSRGAPPLVLRNLRILR